MSYDPTLGAMKVLAERIAKITASYPEAGPPIAINQALEPAYLRAAAEVSRGLKLAEPIPKLCTLVTASAFDAALHDGFGKVHKLNMQRRIKGARSEEHTSELQSRPHLVCRLLLEKKKTIQDLD